MCSEIRCTSFSLSQQLVQLELLCQQLYESHDVQGRAQAEKALVGFTENPDSLPQCQLVLERSQVHVHCICSTCMLQNILCEIIVSFGERFVKLAS